jgi:Uncharacterised protein family (UPF0175)
MKIALDIPDELAPFLASYAPKLERAALEAIALELYREHRLSTGQLRRILGYRARIQVHAFLKEHGANLQHGPEDLEHDRQAGDSIPKPEEGQQC